MANVSRLIGLFDFLRENQILNSQPLRVPDILDKVSKNFLARLRYSDSALQFLPKFFIFARR